MLLVLGRGITRLIKTANVVFRCSPLILGENNLVNCANNQSTVITSACKLKSINTSVLHTQFNVLSWISRTFVFNVRPFLKNLCTYLHPFQILPVRIIYLGYLSRGRIHVFCTIVFISIFTTVRIQEIVCDVCINTRLVFLFTVLGVFAKKVIQKRTQFGPYVGQLSTKLTRYDESRLVLQVKTQWLIMKFTCVFSTSYVFMYFKQSICHLI